MTQPELIANFPGACSIADRVLLVSPSMFSRLCGVSVHECRVFVLVTRGRLRLKTSTTDAVVEAHSLIDMLVWEPVTFVEMSEDIRAWCIMPNYIFTNEALNGLKPEDSESFKDRHKVPFLPLMAEGENVLERLLEQMAAAMADEDHFYRKELCQTFFRAFMLEAGNMMHDRHAESVESEGVENRQDTILRSFLKLVWKYYRTEHNVDFYAQRLCLSSKHLSRVVCGRLGKTPFAVIRDELLQRASYLLRDTKMPVQDISAELHFSEMAAFCKFFKKHKGMSPTAYRAARKQNG